MNSLSLGKEDVGIGLSRALIASSSSHQTTTTTNRDCRINSITILRDDHILEQVLRYVGNNQYRFIGSISKQCHRIYSAIATTTVATPISGSTHNGASKTDASTDTNCANSNTSTPKQTLYNVSTIGHLTICYNETFRNSTAKTQVNDDETDDYSEMELQKTNERRVQATFYRTVGRHSSIVQLQYLYGTLHATYDKEICTAAAGAGRLHVIEFIHKNLKQHHQHPKIGTLWNKSACAKAAECGYLDVLQYLHTSGCPFGVTSAKLAVANGHVHVLQYLIDAGFKIDTGFQDPTWEDVVKNGHLDMIKYLQETNCPINFESLCSLAAFYGNLEMYQYTKNHAPLHGHHVRVRAVFGGNLDIIQDLLAHPGTSSELCSVAAQCGYLHILKYFRSLSMEWNENTCAVAARNGHLHIVQYAHDNGCRWNERTCEEAAENGHQHVLQYAHENGCPWDKSTCLLAAKNGHLHALQYAHDNGCPWDDSICTKAAKKGHLNVLEFAHKNGCPLDLSTCYCAAKNNDLKMLQYAHTNGCPWDEHTIYLAIEHGNLEMVQYAHENGCPWATSHVCALAVKHDQLRVLQYLHKMGCPLDDYSCTCAAQKRKLPVLQYLLDNGCRIEGDIDSLSLPKNIKELVRNLGSNKRVKS